MEVFTLGNSDNLTNSCAVHYKQKTKRAFSFDCDFIK